MDTRNKARVKQMRQNRRKQGFTETNVWIPADVRQAIDSSVEQGVFQTRRMAIIHALETTFKPRKSTA